MKGGLGGSLPIAATEVASSWDTFYISLFWLSVVFFVGVVGAMIYFAVKYKRGKGHQTLYSHGNTQLEIIWTVIPTILLLGIFAWGWVVYKKMVTAPEDSMEIRVIGKQWLWQFQYENGKTTIGDLYVPVNHPIRLVMISDDVLHSFFIPNFRVKQDVVPGQYTQVWFEATVPGKHIVYCAEYCGTAHSGMLANLYVLEPEEWENWRRGKEFKITGYKADEVKQVSKASMSKLSLADRGEKLMKDKGCVACHTSDGSRLVGPSYKGIYGKMETLTDGSKVKVDENYLREAIENPMAKIVKGYEGLVMPPYKGVLSEEEIGAMIAYIKSLK